MLPTPAPPPSLVTRVRDNAIVFGGLTLALAFALNPTLQRWFDGMKDVERSIDVALLPSISMLLVTLVWHFSRKWRNAATAAATTAADARALRSRANQLEALVTLEHAVAASLDLLSLRHALERKLPPLTGARDVWLYLGTHDRRETLTIGRAGHARPADVLAFAEIASTVATNARRSMAEDGPSVQVVDDHACFPLLASGSVVGVLGVALRGVPLDAAEQRVLSAAATVVAIGAKNVELVSQIREHGMRDALTGCFNRAHAIDTLQIELRRASRVGHPVSLVMLDVDHFKEVNDVHGHLAGDAVLAGIGQLLRASLRGSDVKARYGGEEFLIVLPETPADAARRVAEMLRQMIARMDVPWTGGALRVTASIGLTTATPGEVSVDEVIARADRALYVAKAEGRDCVREALEAAPSESAEPERMREAAAVRPPLT